MNEYEDHYEVRKEYLVKIKTWKQMRLENKIDSDGDIVIDDGYVYFTEEMEKELSKIPNRIIILKDCPKYRYLQWETEYDLFDIPKKAIEEILDPKDYPEYFV